MKTTLEVGMYIRSPKGKIEKIDYFVKQDNIIFPYTINCTPRFRSDVKKASFNIKDLIEKGDYVNGYLVAEAKNGNISYLEETEGQLYDIPDIKSIVTKEQFKQMEYKVGE